MIPHRLQRLLFPILSLCFLGFEQQTVAAQQPNLQTMKPKMTVEIWSDVVCPFCFIGKRHFEKALAQFPQRDQLEIVWKSFQLDPNASTAPDKTLAAHMAVHKGISDAQVQGMFAHATQMAAAAGLEYHLEKAVPANSFDAHRLLQYAEEKGRGNEMEETLFRAFFMDGKNIADRETLTRLGITAGLEEKALQAAFTEEKYAAAVRADIAEAETLNITGVPFFVLNRKYGISGAQPPAAMQQSLEKAFAEWKAQHPQTKLSVTEGPTCTPDGVCE